MPKLDQCHYQIVHALEKAGWTVQPKPYAFDTAVNVLIVDIEAERTPEEPLIVVEVKCFPDGVPDMASLYNAIGQYLVYRSLMRELKKNKQLYLAIPSTIYHGSFQTLAMPIVNETKIGLIVVDLDREEIERWLKW